jgi:hypothetical protein
MLKLAAILFNEVFHILRLTESKKICVQNVKANIPRDIAKVSHLFTRTGETVGSSKLGLEGLVADNIPKQSAAFGDMLPFNTADVHIDVSGEYIASSFRVESNNQSSACFLLVWLTIPPHQH